MQFLNGASKILPAPLAHEKMNGPFALKNGLLTTPNQLFFFWIPNIALRSSSST